ncbi:MAG TPA: DUF4349 domain-containing protein [Polyangiaceae bacterium]|nr:DUF4349 domain-containing protein [Polyangiaceae bacterium]
MTKPQRSLMVAFLLTSAVAAGCAKNEEPPPPVAQVSAGPGATAAGPVAAASASPLEQKPNVTNRKIIRQAELELEVAAPGNTQTAIERLAEQHGGYVVSAVRDTESGSAVDVRVTVTVRVPQAELMSTIAELKHFGRGVGSERITSDDVTDEFVDLVARTTSQKQLEQQYLELLKRASNVKDAMEVQRALADVRTEIERMEGRQRLLEKESAFSTLTVHLTTAVPQLAVSGGGFSGTIRRAWSDSLSLSADMISGGIRLAGFFLPVLLLIVLPTGLLIWGLQKLSQRRRAALLANLG